MRATAGWGGLRSAGGVWTFQRPCFTPSILNFVANIVANSIRSWFATKFAIKFRPKKCPISRGGSPICRLRSSPQADWIGNKGRDSVGPEARLLN